MKLSELEITVGNFNGTNFFTETSLHTQGSHELSRQYIAKVAA